MELFRLQNLTFTYPGQTIPALRELSCSIQPGEFVVLMGASGCGKSTLLRQLKTVLTPHGAAGGQVWFRGTPLQEVDARTQAARIGFVQQSPDNQIVTDKVWHELAFGLESLGLDTPTIRGRVAEMASFFGIQSWFHQNVSQLSGGQKQLLNLASIMVMQPDVLILDEPTSQLDPIAASDFLATLGRINRELGTAIVLTEHRLEEVIPMAGRVLVMEAGRLLLEGTAETVFQGLRQADHPMLRSMPAPMRIWNAIANDLPCPMTVSGGRQFLSEYAADHPLGEVPERRGRTWTGTPCVTIREAWFRYERDGPDIVKGLSLRAYPGELLCILGGNGTGKTTMLSLLAGQRRPYRGTVSCTGRIAALPQNPQNLFVKDSLREDLVQLLPKAEREAIRERLASVCRLCRLNHLLDRHPYDLSGGEQQRAALAKILLTRPEILLLDEPTKGLDADFKQVFAGILRELADQGVCVVMVSHDVEFCAAYADRCALFFDGGIVTEDAPVPFFAGKSFYTTAANRMARHLLPRAVTAEDVIAACGGTLPSSKRPDASECVSPPPRKVRPPGLPLWRRILAALSGAAALAVLVYATVRVDLTALFTSGDYGKTAGGYAAMYGGMIAALLVLAAAVTRREEVPEGRLLGGKLSRRTKAAMALILLAIPLTIFAGIRFLDNRRFLVISLLILAETMLPFFLAFEGRKPQARELVILAVLCALGIAGRAAFAALPGFKPVAAMVIVSGVAFGGEAGFLVGAVTMLGSNMFFGQGPWTPWQMLAMGLLGLLSGVLFRKGLLRRDRMSLAVFGAAATLIVYGGLMNPASVLMYQPNPTWQMILTAYITGVPADLIHASATALFLWILSEPMLRKLDRVKKKYGLLESERA